MVLPQMPSKFGVHLPPDEHCLVNTNYQVDTKQEKAAEETAHSKPHPENSHKENFTPPPPPTKKPAPEKMIPIHITSMST